jgi:hypothetical protein
MSFIHKHTWVKIKETYAPPYPGQFEATVSLMAKVVFGVTTILWECQSCKELRKEEMLGKSTIEEKKG